MGFSPPEEMPNLSENWEPEMTEAAPVAVPAGLMGVLSLRQVVAGLGFFLGCWKKKLLLLLLLLLGTPPLNGRGRFVYFYFDDVSST